MDFNNMALNSGGPSQANDPYDIDRMLLQEDFQTQGSALANPSLSNSANNIDNNSGIQPNPFDYTTDMGSYTTQSVSTMGANFSNQNWQGTGSNGYMSDVGSMYSNNMPSVPSLNTNFQVPQYFSQPASMLSTPQNVHPPQYFSQPASMLPTPQELQPPMPVFNPYGPSPAAPAAPVWSHELQMFVVPLPNHPAAPPTAQIMPQYPHAAPQMFHPQGPYFASNPSAPIGMPGATWGPAPGVPMIATPAGDNQQRSSSTNSKGKRKARSDDLPDAFEAAPRKKQQPKKLNPTSQLHTDVDDVEGTNDEDDDKPKRIPKGVFQLCICKTQSKIPRPRNSFILYRQYHAQNTAPGAGHGEKSKILAANWHNEPPHVKALWAKRAAAEKEQHEAKYPNYKYSPKENKRRAMGSASCTCGAYEVNKKASARQEELAAARSEDESSNAADDYEGDEADNPRNPVAYLSSRAAFDDNESVSPGTMPLTAQQLAQKYKISPEQARSLAESAVKSQLPAKEPPRRSARAAGKGKSYVEPEIDDVFFGYETPAPETPPAQQTTTAVASSREPSFSSFLQDSGLFNTDLDAAWEGEDLFGPPGAFAFEEGESIAVTTPARRLTRSGAAGNSAVAPSARPTRGNAQTVRNGSRPSTATSQGVRRSTRLLSKTG